VAFARGHEVAAENVRLGLERPRRDLDDNTTGTWKVLEAFAVAEAGCDVLAANADDDSDPLSVIQAASTQNAGHLSLISCSNSAISTVAIPV